jgi:predicted component of type VI protein secretion system
VTITLDDQLRDQLRTLSPPARDHLRHALVMSQGDRDVVAYHLLRYRDENGTAWANLVDCPTLHPEIRKQFARVLGELRHFDDDPR